MPSNADADIASAARRARILAGAKEIAAEMGFDEARIEQHERESRSVMLNFYGKTKVVIGAR